MLFNKKKKEDEISEDKVDTDIEPKSEKTTIKSGVTAEEFDIEPEVAKDTPEIEDELKDKESIDIDYSFTGAEIGKALKIFQALTLTKKNIIYSAILMLVFGVYAANLIKDPKNTFSMFLAVMCVVVLAFIWLMPKRHIKKTVEAVEKQDMSFKMSVYDTCIKIGEDGATYVMHYNKDITKIIDTDDMYLICAGKLRLFVLPKRYISEDKLPKVDAIFKDVMKENYIEK